MADQRPPRDRGPPPGAGSAAAGAGAPEPVRRHAVHQHHQPGHRVDPTQGGQLRHRAVAHLGVSEVAPGETGEEVVAGELGGDPDHRQVDPERPAGPLADGERGPEGRGPVGGHVEDQRREPHEGHALGEAAERGHGVAHPVDGRVEHRGAGHEAEQRRLERPRRRLQGDERRHEPDPGERLEEPGRVDLAERQAWHHQRQRQRLQQPAQGGEREPRGAPPHLRPRLSRDSATIPTRPRSSSSSRAISRASPGPWWSWPTRWRMPWTR